MTIEFSTRNVVQDLGWGRVVYGSTFAGADDLGALLRDEATGRRDCCVYLADPHVFVALHPMDFFIDPSHVYRLDLTDYRPELPTGGAIEIRPARDRSELSQMNSIYRACRMVTADLDVMETNLAEDQVIYLVAVDTQSGQIIGTVTGIDHRALGGAADSGSSLWSLATDPNSPYPGVGRWLIDALATELIAREAAFIDLSVVHNNHPAIRLYEQVGFVKVAELVVKRKNAINEPLFTIGPPAELDDLNPYARIIADEALRRNIRVRVLDASTGYLELEHAGRTVITRESLSQYTTAVAMSRCDDKRVTRTLVAEAGLRVPQGKMAEFDDSDHKFLDRVGAVVVKPVRGEQGAGITVHITEHDELDAALARAGGPGTEILIEEHAEGEDLRLIVIDGEVVAAAVRRPAEVVATGTKTVRQLIEKQSARRAAATGGESRIPLDDLTEATVREEGWSLDDVPPAGTRIQVRRTANLHTGGTIHDVTDSVSQTLKDAAVTAAATIGIPVTGIDLLVPDVSGNEYVFIEANERPGLANHEPQPVVEAFLDYLMPATRAPHRAG
ncbi:N-acetylglutaminylglutamine synthetase [Enemella sp. A6]|uniref:N-acetylglutaminylglutamine synthetase n=1 Tax=Enemella sp. A6 TaxID=3440152 RepID=UPI003EBC85AF